MPELPEVETIVRSLRGFGLPGDLSLPGQRFAGAEIRWDRSIATPTPSEFQQAISGQEIRAVNRRGKFIVIPLESHSLLVHLRMSGDLRLEENGSPPEGIHPRTHDRVILSCESGMQLVFNDPRKFGRMWLVADPEMVTGKLGPDPLDGQITAETLHRRLHGKHRQIKPLLLDQTFLAGMGNIYTDESLHCARIHPARSSDSITEAEAACLWECIRKTLEQAIISQGSSIDWMYRGGSFQNRVQVYHRTGQPCYTCGTGIQRILIGQRSTHICPYCQRPA